MFRLFANEPPVKCSPRGVETSDAYVTPIDGVSKVTVAGADLLIVLRRPPRFLRSSEGLTADAEDIDRGAGVTTGECSESSPIGLGGGDLSGEVGLRASGMCSDDTELGICRK